MTIDSHQHFWRFDPVRDSWITEDMQVLRRDFLPAELTREMASGGVDACIAVQADQSEAETDFLLDLAAKNVAITGVVGWTDLRSPRLAERLEHYARKPKLRGFRHIVQAEPDRRFLLRPDFLAGVRTLRQHNFTYDILIYANQLPAAIDFVAACPGQRFVLDHIAKPAIAKWQRGPGEFADWQSGIQRLASSPEVFCKLSGLVTEASWKTWRPGDFTPYLDVVFDAFGAGRLMFGSDWPVCLLAASYSQVKKLIADYVAPLPLAQREGIFGGNAVRFYGLPAGHLAAVEGPAN
ncbi:MAG TPA: amidohydrolase family protein [Terriglobales bacterium]|nr:amidohydrolase family protein [Terriglobales bacterium]